MISNLRWALGAPRPAQAMRHAHCHRLELGAMSSSTAVHEMVPAALRGIHRF
jgi:hypothetical protein